MTLTETMLADVAGSLEALQRADQRWRQYCRGDLPRPEVIFTRSEPLDSPDWDVIICGGTLGILVGVALAQRGWRVALLERGVLQGRVQEWNISRRELQELVELELLTPEQLEGAIATEYNPARIQFHGGEPVWVSDVLNVGISPVRLLDTLKQRFLAAGGQLFEHTAFAGATVHPNGVQVQAGADGAGFGSRLLIDAMGHFSPVAAQARRGQQPEAACLVVGTCADGYAPSSTGDLIYSFTPIRHQCQYFWEAFPAADGRTTYLFTYLDLHPKRISLTELFEEYWRLLPEYQQTTLEALTVRRALFGFFPSYRHSPLRYPWGRLLAVGDSSGSQSPLSFGGFGALIRHLPRLIRGIHGALESDCLDAASLGLLQPYQPNLSVTWLFQKSMSVGMHQSLPPERINQLLATIFSDMAALGEPVLKPFLQDVVQFSALTRTLAATTVHHPRLVAQIVPQVGLSALANWLRHYGALAGYSAATPLLKTLIPRLNSLSEVQRYYGHRWLDACRYGSGDDY